MRFVFSVAFKYLIPRWRQLSVSIISLVSILVISLVVWLVIVFLSVTEGIEKNWIRQLVALNAPVRVIPTEAYYNSYYYQIDSVASNSNYSHKTLGEKLKTESADPYDPEFDAELASSFPKNENTDLVKETWRAIESLKGAKNLRPSTYEVAFGNMRLSLNHDLDQSSQSYLSQASYVAAYDHENKNLHKLLLPLSADDYSNLLQRLTQASSNEEEEIVINDSHTLRSKLAAFFDNVNVTSLRTEASGLTFPPALFPEQGIWSALGILHHGKVARVVIPSEKDHLDQIKEEAFRIGSDVVVGRVEFHEKVPTFIPDGEYQVGKRLQFILEGGHPLKAKLLSESTQQATSLASIQFEVKTSVQNTPLSGIVDYDSLEISDIETKVATDKQSPLWVFEDRPGSYLLPKNSPLGEGVLLTKHFKQNGVLVGDQGYLSYYTPTASGLQEQRLPIYVAGFYDAGLVPTGNRLLFADQNVIEALRVNSSVSDKSLGNGIHLWFDNIDSAEAIKAALITELENHGLSRYFSVESFRDYEFAKPLLQQLSSDKNLFTLIAIIILVVACSNIVSMLILLVNDKKREIGILQSMGASSWHIASIFGISGFFTGLISSVIGTLTAIYTLKHLQSLVNFLSFLQGQDAFQSAFYGSTLPNELSLNALFFIFVATMIISLLAGIAPAIKAVRIKPSEILRSE